MTSIYYLERYTILAIGFLVCGILSFFLNPPSSSLPYVAIMFLGAGVLAAAYVLKNRRSEPGSDNIVFPKIDEREMFLLLKASWVVCEISIIVLLFAAFNAGQILTLIDGDVSEAVVYAVRSLLMGLAVFLMIVRAIAHTYFGRKI